MKNNDNINEIMNLLLDYDSLNKEQMREYLLLADDSFKNWLNITLSLYTLERDNIIRVKNNIVSFNKNLT